MIVPPKVADKYDQNKQWIAILKDKVKDTLIPYCERNQFAFVFRIKTLESTAEKIETGRFKEWDKIDDFFACTIIIPTLEAEESVINDLKRFFNIDKIKKRGASQKSPESFRYDSTRVISKLKQIVDKNRIHDILFEIQIKSAFEYAWSVATHSLTYKTSFPAWKRLRLSSQLKASVEQLDSLIVSFEDTSKFIKESPWVEIKLQNIICDFISGLSKQSIIPEELLPKDYNRFSKNLFELLMATKWFNFYDVSAKIKCTEHILINIEYELNQLQHIPRSISLFQLFLGFLVKRNYITPPLNKYTLLITPELEIIFPEVKKFDKIFIY